MPKVNRKEIAIIAASTLITIESLFFLNSLMGNADQESSYVLRVMSIGAIICIAGGPILIESIWPGVLGTYNTRYRERNRFFLSGDEEWEYIEPSARTKPCV